MEMDHHLIDPIIPSDGARLTYEQVAQGGVNQINLNEAYNPIIYQAARPHEIADMMLLEQHGTERPIFLVRRDGAQHAYALTHKQEEAKNLAKPGRPDDWGQLYYAEICPIVRNSHNAFLVPMKRQLVVIKRLKKSAISRYIHGNPGGENPYKELARMDELGDNIHVLKHIEALEDDIYLYMVMPKGWKTLAEVIKWHKPYTPNIREMMAPALCHKIFRHIIKILAHLERHSINHHDLSPDNLLFLSEGGNLVLFDFALSDRIPINPSTGQRTLIIRPHVVYGTRAWMDPVVYQGIGPYDGVAMDLWAVALILYNMSTNEALFNEPSPNDVDYRHFISFAGLWSHNEQTVDHLHYYGSLSQLDPKAFTLLRRLHKLSELNLNVSDQIIDLLKNMLNENPSRRFTLAQVMCSDYVTDFHEY
jgi:serine/threonine protein kinase